MSLRFYPRAELGKEGGNNPGADTNPPEDQEDAVERVEVACQLMRRKRSFCKTKPPSPRAGGSSLVPPNRLEENGVVRWFQPPRERKYRV